jgi:CRISPR/Cas system Type II protein with McrA/HNH and RuvC-like nuclease domain
MALSKEELKGLYVGQELFVVYTPHRRGNAPNTAVEKVTKIGSKYFYVNEGENKYSEHKHDKETGAYVADYTSYPPVLYFDEATYRQDKEAKELWGKYRDITTQMYSKPPHLTTEMVKELIEILTPPTEE